MERHQQIAEARLAKEAAEREKWEREEREREMAGKKDSHFLLKTTAYILYSLRFIFIVKIMTFLFPLYIHISFLSSIPSHPSLPPSPHPLPSS